MAARKKALCSWLGTPPTAELRAPLERHVRLREGWADGARLVLAWAGSGTEVLSELPRARPEVLAVSLGPPQVRERLAWIRAGASDLVSAADLPAAVERRVRALPEQAQDEEPEAAPAPPSAPPAPPPPPRRALLGPGPFPPVAVDPAEPVEVAQRAVDSLISYVQRRNALGRALGASGEGALLALVHQRDLLPGAGLPLTQDPYGQRCGPSPPWPVALRSAEDPGDDAPIREGTLTGLGRDALTLALDQPSSPHQKLLIDLSLGDRGHAQLLVTCRWQRRVASRRWMLGALILKARRRHLTSSDDPADR